VLTWWFSGVPGRTGETFLGRSFDKNRARTTTTQSPTVSQMPLGDELRECDTKTSRTFSSNPRRRVFWGSFTSGRDGWESPTPEGGRRTHNTWHLGEDFLVRTSSFSCSLSIFNRKCRCCNHVLERWIPGVIFFFP
jgi:hypothetical protein